MTDEAGGPAVRPPKTERPFFAMPYPGIFRVTCPLPFPGLDHVHAYLAEGPEGGLVLIDTTLGYEDSFARLEQGVRWLDRELVDIERIVLTHAHPDHIGLSAQLQEISGAPVVCHPIAERMFAEMGSGDRWRQVAEHYTEHGRAPEPGGDRGFRIGVPEVIEHVSDGDEIAFAGGRWEVSWTPGHEWGHVVFFRRSDGVLVVGDTLLGKITPHIGYMVEPPDPLGQFLGSLDTVEGLEPSFVVPGHGRPFEDGAGRARAIRAHHEHRLRRCVEVLVRGGPMSALDVARELFGEDLMFFEERLALAETLSHLEHLRLKGRLIREKVDGVWRYELARVVP